ncbi:MAG: PD-(D/E)XK nuclease family protein [Methanomassiliicoccales archaeon]
MGKIKFVRGTPRALYRSAISCFLDDFKTSPLEVGLLVPRPGLAMHVRSELLKGMTVPTFCVTDLDDLVAYLFDQHEKELRPVGGHALRNIIQSIIIENAKDFPSLVKDGAIADGILDDLLTLVRTLRDFQADLSSFRPDEVIRVDVPLFLSLYEKALAEKGLVDLIGMRSVLAERTGEWTSERPYFRKLVIIGGFEPTPSQISVLRALIKGSGETVYHHPYVSGKDRVFKQPVIDLGCELEVIDLDMDDEDETRSAMADPWGEGEKVDLSKTIRMGRYLDPLEEARQVAQRISALLESGADPSSIAIFLPDRREALPLVREVLADFSIPFRTDLGMPLSTSPAVHAALSVLEAVAQGYDASALTRLLSSPYVRWEHDSDPLWHVDIDRYSRMAGILRGKESWSKGLQFLIDDLNEQAGDPEVPEVRRKHMEKDALRIAKVKASLEALLKELEDLEGEKPFSEHLRSFRKALEVLEVSKQLERSLWRNPDGAEAKAYSKLQGLLSSLERDCCIEDVNITLADFISELRREIGEKQYHPGIRFDRAVSVAGYRTLSGMNFEHTFLLSTLEGDMPKLGVKHSFITVSQAKQVGLLDEEDILRQERFYFLSAVLGGDQVDISYPAYQAGKKVLPSPFLQDLQKNCLLGEMGVEPITHSMRCAHMSTGKALTGEVPDAVESWLPRSTISPAEICERLNFERSERSGPYHSEHDGVICNGETLSNLNSRMKDKVYSATMLETYRRCPMSYFLKYVLYLSPLEGDEDSESLRIGNAAHRILFRFYQERIGSGLGLPSPADVEAAKAEIRRIGGEVRQELMADGAVSEASFRALIGDEEMNGALGKFVDTQAEKDMPRWAPAHLEFSFGHRFSKERSDERSTERPAEISLSEDPDDRLLLRGKVDRLDAQDGNFVIIDYKTGSVPGYSSMAKGYHMQLPLYLMACEKLLNLRAAGGAYYQLKNGDKFGMQLRTASSEFQNDLGGKKDAYKPGLREDLEICRRNVKEVLEGISHGKFHPVDSAEGERCSSYCLFSRICRKDDMRVLQMSLAKGVQ